MMNESKKTTLEKIYIESGDAINIFREAEWENMPVVWQQIALSTCNAETREEAFKKCTSELTELGKVIHTKLKGVEKKG